MLAKGLNAKKKLSPAGAEVCDQLESSTKRLQVLQHEMQKRRIQLQDIQENIDNGQNVNQASGPLTATGSDEGGDLIRVIFENSVTRMEITKSVFIRRHETASEVIATVLNKANIPESIASFSLSYKKAASSI